MSDPVEHELCANCKKEIPQSNYVMHTMHCARNISLCTICKEPIPKNKLVEHIQKHTSGPKPAVQKKQPLPDLMNDTIKTSTITYEKQKKTTISDERLGRRLSDRTTSSSGTIPKQVVKPEPPQLKTPPQPEKPEAKSLLACKYCDLELPKLDLEEHENYCGSRTDKCNECGEFVMFKYKKIHEDSNHGFLKLSDEPGPKPSWDSNTQRTSSASQEAASPRRSRFQPRSAFDMSNLYNVIDYIPPSISGRDSTSSAGREKAESYKDLSRRLDSKTEYIKNVLHDSANITAPLRSAGTAPRNHFNHQKGKAPTPPHRRRNPPTELTIPCEFCDTPIPHEDLIQHETGCRPDLARFNPKRRSLEDDDYYFEAPPEPSSPEVELPCEFCDDMFPASQLLRHQLSCN